MRKFSSMLLCLLVTGSLLSACGGNNNAADNKEGNNAPAVTNTATDAPTNAPAEDDITQRKVTIKIHYPTPDLTEMRTQEDDRLYRYI